MIRLLLISSFPSWGSLLAYAQPLLDLDLDLDLESIEVLIDEETDEQNDAKNDAKNNEFYDVEAEQNDVERSEIRDSIELNTGSLVSLLGDADSESLWIDGEAIRYLTMDYRVWSGIDIGVFFDELLGVHIIREGDFSHYYVFSNKSYSIPIPEDRQEHLWKLYRIEVPRVIHFTVRVVDGVLLVQDLAKQSEWLTFLFKIRWFADGVTMERITIDLNDGKIQLHARLLKNWLRIVLKAQLYSREYDGVSYLRTLLGNLFRIFSSSEPTSSE